MVWLCSVLMLAAWAGEPSRCVAVHRGPIEDCDLPGEWSASGVGPSEAKATSAAVQRLVDAIELGAAARAERAAGTMAAAQAEPQRRSCPSSVRAAVEVSCFPEQRLLQDGLCFARFDDEDCWRGPAIYAEGRRWKMIESGKDQLCREMSASLVERQMAQDQQRACQIRCIQHAEVRCK